MRSSLWWGFQILPPGIWICTDVETDPAASKFTAQDFCNLKETALSPKLFYLYTKQHGVTPDNNIDLIFTVVENGICTKFGWSNLMHFRVDTNFPPTLHEVSTHGSQTRGPSAVRGTPVHLMRLSHLYYSNCRMFSVLRRSFLSNLNKQKWFW